MIADIQAIVLANSATHSTGKNLLTEKLCGKEVIVYSLSVLQDLHIPTTIVVGHQSHEIKKIVEQHYPTSFSYKEQATDEGTAQAVQLTKTTWDQQDIIIMKADVPLLKKELIEKLYKKHKETDAMLTFAYAHYTVALGTSYDKVVKNKNNFSITTSTAIQERTEETEEEFCCVDGGILIAKRTFLASHISKIKRNKNTNKFHLSDIVAIAHGAKQSITAVSVPFDQIRSTSSLQELWAAEQIKRSELIKYWMERGVRFSAAQTVHIDADISIGTGSFIGCGAHLTQGTTVGNKCTIGPFSILINSQIGDNVCIEPYSVLRNTKVGNGCSVGPFAHVQETVLGTNCQVGNFVEIKRSVLGDHTKAKHLAYLGDAQIGAHVNIGAGSITCNYDGKNKHTTTINDGAFIGTNTSLIAPITIGSESFTAAGSVITENVPPGALAIARAPQVNKEGYMAKRDEKEPSHTTHSQEKKPSFSFLGAVKAPTNPTTE